MQTPRETFFGPTRKAVGAARDVQQLAEQSAEEEQDHPGLHEADEAAHIGVKQAGGDVHLVDDHENDGADNAANQGRNVFVAEQTDKQDCSYEDEDVHKYSPKNIFDTSCQAIKLSAASSASPNAFDESSLTEECTLLLLVVCLTVESEIGFRRAPDQSFMMLLR